MIRNWLMTLIREVLPSWQSRRVPRQDLRRRSRPRLETLEDREVPAVVANSFPALSLPTWYAVYIPLPSAPGSSGTDDPAPTGSREYDHFVVESTDGSPAGLNQILADCNFSRPAM
jgi:hypothetical protein